MSCIWTFGAEHEFADIDRFRSLPAGFGWDIKDNTIVNSSGIANDPKGEMHRWGGEVNTPPTSTIEGQMATLADILVHDPQAKINYRSNLHCHIRVPGLAEDLRALKRLAMYNLHWLPIILPIIEPIPAPTRESYPREGDFLGAKRRYKRRKRSHHTVLSAARTADQLEAYTVREFHTFEVPWTKAGVPMWYAQPRAAVNLRQLIQTDTIEFRHFPGTLDVAELRHCFRWCENYLLCALCPSWGLKPENLNPLIEFEKLGEDMLFWTNFPTFAPYDHALEIRYRATVHDGTIPKEQIANNIKAIEENRFNDAEWEAWLKW